MTVQLSLITPSIHNSTDSNIGGIFVIPIWNVVEVVAPSSSVAMAKTLIFVSSNTENVQVGWVTPSSHIELGQEIETGSTYESLSP